MDSAHKKENNVQVLFEGESVPDAGSTAYREDPFDDGINYDIGLHDFLNRPVLIHSDTWAVGAPFTFTIDPVALWASNSAIQAKLEHYAMVKFDIEITVHVKGTVYHAGLLLLSVRRLGQINEFITIAGDTQIITRSQRPSTQIEVGGSKSATLIVPFSNLNNYYETKNFSTSSQILDSSFRSAVTCDSYTILRGVNTTTSISVLVFAKAINVKVAAPSIVAASGDCPPFEFVACSGKSEGFTMNVNNRIAQRSKKAKAVKRESKVLTKDEYQSAGPVSTIASSVASAAGQLTMVPYIGPFAKATEIGAGALSNIASLFGFSRPVEIRSILPYRPMPISSLALTDATDVTQKLTVTSKQEICIDPTTVGMPSEDVMSINYLCKERYSYLNQFTWDPTDAVGDVLYYVAVTPMLERVNAVTGGTQVIPTSLSFCSRAFRSWCGSLQFRIQILATRFHTGRIAFIYEPCNTELAAGTNPYNINFNFVMDLADGLDQTFEIAWQQPMPYAYVLPKSTTGATHGTSSFAPGTLENGCNGYWYAKVFNKLAVSDDITPVAVIISVKAGDDFELMNPQARNIYYTSPYPYVAASGDAPEFEFVACSDEADKSVPEFGPGPVNTPIGLASTDSTGYDLKGSTFYGERVESMRSLIKRYCFYRRPTYNGGTSHIGLSFTAFPLFPGDYTGGVDTGSTGQKTNYVGQSWLTYLAGAYGAWRGGIRYKMYAVEDYIQSITITRGPNTGPSGSIPNTYIGFMVPAQVGTLGSFVNLLDVVQQHSQTMNGSAVAVLQTVNSLEFELPYQCSTRASLVDYDHQSTPVSPTYGYPSGDMGIMYMNGKATRLTYDMYVAAAEDFSFYCFNGAPVFYTYIAH